MPKEVTPVRLDPAMKAEIDAAAKEERRTRGDMTRLLIEDALRRRAIRKRRSSTR